MLPRHTQSPSPPRPPTNPFIIGTLPTGAAFANRADEVKRIAQAFREAGSKLIVYGERRLGKSATLDIAAMRVRRSGGPPVAIVDLSTALGPSDAANRILAAVHRAVGMPWRDSLEAIARRLRLAVTLTLPTDGTPPGVGINFGGADRGENVPHRLVPDVLDALEAELARRKLHLGLGLDEFQRIHQWGGADAEWALRGAMQKHRAIAYVMAGSARSLIESMVADKTRAFWKLADTLRMEPIEPAVFAEWLRARAHATEVELTSEAATAIVHLAGPRTRDVVQLARAVWDGAEPGGRKMVGAAAVGQVFERVVTEQGALLEKVWTTETQPAQQVLRALAASPAIELTAADALTRYRLPPKSTVQQTVRRLVEREILTEVPSPGRYTFDDPFFRRWVERQTLPDIGLPVPALGIG